MRHSIRVLAGMAVSAAVFTSAAYAQDMTTYSFGGSTTRLGLSDDEIAFIGAASFETRKQFGRRTSLSLVTDYEWYSFAPKMKYVNADRNGCSEVEDGPLFNCPGTVNRTHISDDDAFEVRNTLRLNIALGAAGLYAEPIK